MLWSPVDELSDANLTGSITRGPLLQDAEAQSSGREAMDLLIPSICSGARYGCNAMRRIRNGIEAWSALNDHRRQVHRSVISAGLTNHFHLTKEQS
jgi:hypothetical protein